MRIQHSMPEAMTGLGWAEGSTQHRLLNPAGRLGRQLRPSHGSGRTFLRYVCRRRVKPEGCRLGTGGQGNSLELWECGRGAVVPRARRVAKAGDGPCGQGSRGWLRSSGNHCTKKDGTESEAGTGSGASRHLVRKGTQGVTKHRQESESSCSRPTRTEERGGGQVRVRWLT